jgi:hypothetical protein
MHERKQVCDAIHHFWYELCWLQYGSNICDYPILSSIVLELQYMTCKTAPIADIIGTRLWDLLDSLSGLIESEFGTGFPTRNRIFVKRYYQVIRCATDLTNLMNKLSEQSDYRRNQYIAYD